MNSKKTIDCIIVLYIIATNKNNYLKLEKSAMLRCFKTKVNKFPFLCNSVVSSICWFSQFSKKLISILFIFSFWICHKSVNYSYSSIFSVAVENEPISVYYIYIIASKFSRNYMMNWNFTSYFNCIIQYWK